MKVAVIGLGYWGPNLVRNFQASALVSEVVCYDRDRSRIDGITVRYPNVKAAPSFESVLASDCDAVAIATPIADHHALAIRVLASGKHLFVEKPLASTVRQCEEILDGAARKNLVVMVDHTFLYTGAVRKIKEIISKGDIGDVYYFDSVRVNLGLFQHDVNVLWDLAPHDLSIMSHLFPEEPTGVSAVGVNHYNHVEDMAYLTVHFPGNMIAHIHVNWLAPVKIRRILIGGSKRMIVFDDMEPSEKVKVYDTGVRVVTREGIYKTLVEYRTGDMFAPKIDQVEALNLVTQDFIESIQTGRPPISNGLSGLRIVRMLEAAEKSMRAHGALVQL